MRTYPDFAEVPAPKPRDVQYRIYLYLLLGVGAYVLLESSLLASSLILIPAVAVGLVLWWRHSAILWSSEAVESRSSTARDEPRMRLGWSRSSRPHYAARGGDHIVPFGPYGGGAIHEGRAGLLVVLATILIALGVKPHTQYFLLFALPLGALFGFILWLKHR